MNIFSNNVVNQITHRAIFSTKSEVLPAIIQASSNQTMGNVDQVEIFHHVLTTCWQNALDCVVYLKLLSAFTRSFGGEQ